jgi:hypothetical protein
MPRKSSRNELQTVACPSKTKQLNFRLPLEAYEHLREIAPTPKSYGETIAMLLYEDRARREERQRLATKYKDN